jgi:hypothetical protein
VSLCGNDTRSPVTSRESAAHGHTQREGKIHGARPPATPSNSAGRPGQALRARGPHSRPAPSPPPARGAQTRREPAPQTTQLVCQVSAEQIGPAARWRLPGRRTGEWLQHPCRGGGGSRSRGGDAKGGCPERARRRSAHPRAGPSRPSGHPAPTGSPRPLCRAPLCALSERRGSMAFRGARAPRGAGRGGEPRSGTVRAAAAAAAARPTRAARRPLTPAGRRDGAAGAAGRLCGAHGGSALALGRAVARLGAVCGRGWQSGSRGRGLGGAGERGARGRRVAAASDAAPGVCKWSEADRRQRRRRRRRPGVESDEPRRQGARRPPRPFHGGAWFPLPRSWRPARPWVCTRLARGLPGRPRSPGPGARCPRDRARACP